MNYVHIDFRIVCIVLDSIDVDDRTENGIELVIIASQSSSINVFHRWIPSVALRNFGTESSRRKLVAVKLFLSFLNDLFKYMALCQSFRNEPTSITC